MTNWKYNSAENIFPKRKTSNDSAFSMSNESVSREVANSFVEFISYKSEDLSTAAALSWREAKKMVEDVQYQYAPDMYDDSIFSKPTQTRDFLTYTADMKVVEYAMSLKKDLLNEIFRESVVSNSYTANLKVTYIFQNTPKTSYYLLILEQARDWAIKASQTIKSIFHTSIDWLSDRVAFAFIKRIPRIQLA